MGMQRTALLLLFFITACSMPLTLHKDLADSGIKQPPSEKCGECHIAIYDEWKNSGHSRAFTDTFFRSMTNDYMVTDCVNCHSPESAFSKEILLRKANLDEGVNCQTCHLHKGVLQGPVEKHLPFEIHPIMEKNRDYLKSDLCGNCHKKAFEEYKISGEREKTCQDCHMREVKRTIIDNKPWVWFKDKYTFKQHSFNIQDTKAVSENIEIAISIEGNSPLTGEVIIENQSIPHNIPTGGYGYHEVILNISLIDDMSEQTEKISYSMTQEMGTSLKKGERRTFSFAFSDRDESPLAIKTTLMKTDFERKNTKLLVQKILNLR
jgi:hypothetical protein